MTIGKNFLQHFGDTPDPTPVPNVPPVEVAPTDPIPEPTPTPEPVVPVDPIPDPVPPVDPTPTPDPIPEPTPDPIVPVDPPASTITDDAVKAYLKEKYGKEVESVDSLFKEPEAVADPLEGMSDDAKAFIKYSKETGRDYSQYQSLNRDIDAISPLDIAREKAIKQSNGALSKADVDEYLEKKLGIDLTDTKELDKFSLIEINQFGQDYKNQLLEDKKTYATPVKKEPVDTDMVTLDNGTQMTRANYKIAQDKRNQYLDNVKKASDKITASSFEIKIDDNGTEKVMPLSYEYSKQDVHEMASNASDIDSAFSKLFSGENGNLDHAKIQEGLFWANDSNRGKAINAIVHKALAKQAEEFMAIQHNVKTDTKQMPATKSNVKTVPLPGQKQVNTGYLQHFQTN